jgi:ParB-like chromosome segregation protein Spo0J
MENIQRVDWHCLIARFAPLRLRDPQRLVRLTRSLRQQGQLVPVVAVAQAGEPPRWVLIDGYRRVQALRAVGEDLVWVDVWACSVDEALLLCLARGPERGWEAIEEGALIQDLCTRHSLRDIASRIGRDVSWVSRRRSLFSALPEELLEAVRAGRLSAWAASRILAPLARANTAHARALLTQLEHQPLSTRELERLYSHYQQAPRVQRERLVENPRLFLQALQSTEETRQSKRLAEGPEGAWCQDLAVVSQILKRLASQVPTLFAGPHDAVQGNRLQQAFASMKAQFQHLDTALAQAHGHDR